MHVNWFSCHNMLLFLSCPFNNTWVLHSIQILFLFIIIKWTYAVCQFRLDVGFLLQFQLLMHGNNIQRGRKLSQHVYTLTQNYLHHHDKKKHNCISIWMMIGGVVCIYVRNTIFFCLLLQLACSKRHITCLSNSPCFESKIFKIWHYIFPRPEV